MLVLLEDIGMSGQIQAAAVDQAAGVNDVELALTHGVLGRCSNLAPALTVKKAPTPTALSSQSRLADFDKIAVLGRGNGGTVYKVHHRGTCALYALKVQHYGDPSVGAEADVLSRTASPYVVRCHSAGSAWLAGLAYLHARCIVHLDIKAVNLLVSTAGEVKIAKLRHSKDPIPHQRAVHIIRGHYCGPVYMSRPRALRPLGAVRALRPIYAADLWILEVTIIELLMGQYPLLPAGQQPRWASLMCAVCLGETPALSDGTSSLELQGFVVACLYKDYRKRASVAVLLAHLFVPRWHL
ncbi:hypothetical protein ACQ4PT_023743 [Festuca glaucescens]